MRKQWGLVLVAVLAALMLPAISLAAEPVYSGLIVTIGAGETVMPDYDAMFQALGMAREDYTMSFANDTSTYQFDDEGRITMSERVTRPSTMHFYFTCTPKVSGLKTIQFRGIISVYEPLTELRADRDNVVVTMDEQTTLRIIQPRDTGKSLKISGYDTNIIDAVLVTPSSSSYTWNIQITPKAKGHTVINVVAYNGLTITVPVTVVSPPTGVSFAQESFDCFLGETVDLGTSFGTMGMSTEPSLSTRKGSGYIVAKDWFSQDWTKVTPEETGEFTFTLTTYNGHSGSVKVNVYDKAICTKLQTVPEIVNVGDPYVYIHALDAEERRIAVPLTISQGSDIAYIENGMLRTTGEGTVVITAINYDGTTVDLTVPVGAVPTAVSFNTQELVLDIGDTFDLQVLFDRGTMEYSLNLSFDGSSPAFNLYPVKLTDHRLTAQAPGMAWVSVYAGSLMATCTITVQDSDEAVHIVTPEEPFGMGDTFQLSVQDRTGKVYPAVFDYEVSAGDQSATVTPEGLLTGVFRGMTRITATLEDGRVLWYDQQVYQVPTVLQHSAISRPINHTTVGLEPIVTDVGLIYSHEVKVSIADESIATFGGSYFDFHKEGSTEVTLTALRGGAQTSFVLTVLPADGRLYPTETLMNVPSGYTMKLPVVTDFYGNVTPVQWEITYSVAGLGNPQSTGFSLKGDQITCTWPYAFCQVTGTAASGQTVRIDVHGYRLAKEIRFQQPEYTVLIGDHVQTEIEIVEMNYGLSKINWTVGDPSIIAFESARPQTGRPTATGLKEGVTTLTATLINGVSATCTIRVIRPEPVGYLNVEDDYYYINGQRALDYTGMVPYDGSSFYVVHGKLNRDANGLTLVGDKFLFLSGGQLQYHFGFALYDNEWFYLDGGELDLNATGLYEYDGGVFIIAVGRLVSEYTGLAEVGDGWYYVVNGQVQTQYTGPVEWSGAIFYVENGKMV